MSIENQFLALLLTWRQRSVDKPLRCQKHFRLCAITNWKPFRNTPKIDSQRNAAEETAGRSRSVHFLSFCPLWHLHSTWLPAHLSLLWPFFYNQLAVSPLATALVKALRSQPTLDPEESFWPVLQTKQLPITKSDLHDLLFHHVTAALRKRCVNAERHCLTGSVKCPRGGRSAIFVSMATS